MTTWEYFVAPLLEHNPGEILNTFGQDGWELVSVVAQPTPSGATSTEKSTGMAGQLNAVQANGELAAPATDAKFCSIDNPECESCQ